MKFTIFNSPIKPMNGRYEVYTTGAVKDLDEDRLLTPSIHHLVKWSCEEGDGLIWIEGFEGFRLLHAVNYLGIMQDLGFY